MMNENAERLQLAPGTLLLHVSRLDKSGAPQRWLVSDKPKDWSRGKGRVPVRFVVDGTEAELSPAHFIDDLKMFSRTE